MRLKGKVVLITGSTRGIGFSTAIEFLKGGDRVVIFCRHKEHVMKATSQLAGHGERQNILDLVPLSNQAEYIHTYLSCSLIF